MLHAPLNEHLVFCVCLTSRRLSVILGQRPLESKDPTRSTEYSAFISECVHVFHACLSKTHVPWCQHLLGQWKWSPCSPCQSTEAFFLATSGWRTWPCPVKHMDEKHWSENSRDFPLILHLHFYVSIYLTLQTKDNYSGKSHKCLKSLLNLSSLGFLWRFVALKCLKVELQVV